MNWARKNSRELPAFAFARKCARAGWVLLFGLCCRQAGAETERPNILMVVADDWSYPHAGAYGTAWVKTPTFDRLAQQGVVFTQSYTPVAKCSASRATLVTGRNPWLNDAGFTHWNFFPPQFPSYSEVLAEFGYVTAYTGKGWAPGLALTEQGQSRELLGKAYQKRRLKPPTTEINTVDYLANFKLFLDETPGEAPWCFWLGFHEPHRPYEFGTGSRLGRKRLSDIPEVPEMWPDTPEVREDLLDYALEVEYLDHVLGEVIAELEQRGQLANTVVVVTSDNGMPFPRSKGQCYEVAHHMPLAIYWPEGIPHPGRVVDDFVSHADLAPTLFEIAGIDPGATRMAPFSGHSILPLLRSAASGRIDPSRDRILVGRERHDPGRPNNEGYPIRGIITRDHVYLYNFAPSRWPSGNPELGYLDVDSGATKSKILEARRRKGSDPYWALSFGRRETEELYNRATDPTNVRNLAASASWTPIKAALHHRLWDELTAEGDPRLVGDNPDYFDQFPFARPEFNDYYERWQRGEDVLVPRAFDPNDREAEPLD